MGWIIGTCMFGEDNPSDPYLIPTDRALLTDAENDIGSRIGKKQ